MPSPLPPRGSPRGNCTSPPLYVVGDARFPYELHPPPPPGLTFVLRGCVPQVIARKNELPLDRMTTVCDVTKKISPDEVEQATRDGAYIHGFFLEGARWDTGSGMMDDSILKQLYCPMPVVLLKAALMDKGGQRDTYECPAYKTLTRNPVDGKPTGGYIFSAGLKTKQNVNKWILAGVALIMDVEAA